MHIKYFTQFSFLGNCVEAFSKYGESLEVMRRVYGPEHPSIADTLKSQASVHEMLGKFHVLGVFYTYFYTSSDVMIAYLSIFLFCLFFLFVYVLFVYFFV